MPARWMVDIHLYKQHMQLQLTRPIVFFDLETTGIDIAKDRIVEIALLKIHPDGSEDSKLMRLNPQMHIPAEASAVNGITDADVAHSPTFADKADEIWTFIDGCDLGGFNSNHFDIPLLAEEFLRAGMNVDLRKAQFVDVQNIYHKLERRTLAAAYKFYCHRELTDAHTAMADTRATYEVLCAQLDRYPDDLHNDTAFLAEYSRRTNNVDYAGRIVLDNNGVETINFGKYKGKPVAEVLRRDPSFYSWVMQGDFTRDTKQAFTALLVRGNQHRK